MPTSSPRFTSYKLNLALILCVLCFVLYPAVTANAQAAPFRTIYGLGSNNTLFRFNSTTPDDATNIGTITGVTGNLIGIDFRPANGLLYAVSSDGGIYTINISTAAATLVSTLTADATDATAPFTALSGTDFGVDFNPLPDRLRIVSNTGQNLRVNVSTGATTTDSDLSYGIPPPFPNVFAAAYSNNIDGATATTLYDLDAGIDSLVVQNPPNDGTLTVQGALGVDASQVGGFDIAPGSGTQPAFAALNLAGAPTVTTLYLIDLTTGASTSLGDIDSNTQTITDISIAPITDAEIIYAVTVNNDLVSFPTNDPGDATMITTTGISGLQPGEQIIGIDFRPSNNVLYGASDRDRLYIINITDGSATVVSSTTTVGDGTQFTYPDATPTSTSIGFDFNPSAGNNAGRIRINTDRQENFRLNQDSAGDLRIDGDDGNATPIASIQPDGDLRYAVGDINAGRTPFVSGAAYSNNDIDPDTGTTLYVLDRTLNILALQGSDPGNGTAGDDGNPNTGVLTTIGSLGVDIGNQGGFDIAARSQQAYAVYNVIGDSVGDVSVLLRVNRVTGFATAGGEVGNGLLIRAMSIFIGTPLAANGTINGRVTTSTGVGMSGVHILLRDNNTGAVRQAITNSQGFYSFTEVETTHLYTVVAARRSVSFAPASRTISIVGDSVSDTAEVSFSANQRGRRIRRSRSATSTSRSR